MNVNACRGKARLLEHAVPLGCRAGDPGFSPVAHDEPAAAAAAWVARRFGVRPSLALTVAAQAGLGGAAPWPPTSRSGWWSSARARGRKLGGQVAALVTGIGR